LKGAGGLFGPWTGPPRDILVRLKAMGARILVLEDDVPLACEIQAALGATGCEVEILRDGNAGLARAASDRFDLVIASLELPGMNGFRFCNRLKKAPTGRSIPVFLLSEQPSPDVFDEHRKLSTRADSYFHKPLTMAELIAQVRACLVPAAEGDGESDLLDDLLITDGASSEAAPARDAGLDSSATASLRARIAEHEQTNVRLMHELAAAHADAEKARAQMTEALGRSQRELDQWKTRAHSIAPRADAAVAREEVAERERIVAKDAQIARLRKELDAALHAATELRERIQTLEAERPPFEQKLEQLARQVASLEKVLGAAREDKEQAARRSVDLARRLEKVRPEIEKAELDLMREKEGRQADGVAHALALAELAAKKDSEHAETDRKRSEDLAAKDAQSAEDAAMARQEQEAEAARLREEIAALRLEHATQMADVSHLHQAELGLAKRSHEQDLATLREQIRADAMAKVRAELELEFGQAMDDLRGDLEVERSHVFAQMERAHAVALRSTMKNGEQERALLSARLAEREKALADAEETIDRERRGDHGRTNETAARIDGLEALAASRDEDVERLARELDEARREVPALEAEIIAFRTELTSMRLQLDDQAILTRATNDELAEARRRLATTESALREALARLVAIASTSA